MISKLYLIVFVISFSFCLHADSVAKPQLFRFNKEKEFIGFTPEGVKRLEELRDNVRLAYKQMKANLLNMDDIIHTVFVARLHKGHMFIYGPPGGAKSLLVRNIFEHEMNPPFQIQLNQQMSENVLIGGQDFEAAKQGRYEINTEGSLLDFETGLIDEFDKGMPKTLSPLLELLNEGEVKLGKRVQKAKLQTLASTGNAILPEILDYFRESGSIATAEALLNRFQFKIMVHNWLPDADKEYLDRKVQEKRWKEALAYDGQTGHSSDEEKSALVDWTALRAFSTVLFKTDPLANLALHKLENELRRETHKFMEESKKLNLQDPDKYPFAYYPTFDFTERLRQNIAPVVAHSAFISFLLSDRANDLSTISNTIALGVKSLWRSHVLLTTLTSSKTHFDNEKLKIDFAPIDRSSLRDQREKYLADMLEGERRRFQASLSKILAEQQKEDKFFSRWMGRGNEEL